MREDLSSSPRLPPSDAEFADFARPFVKIRGMTEPGNSDYEFDIAVSSPAAVPAVQYLVKRPLIGHLRTSRKPNPHRERRGSQGLLPAGCPVGPAR